MLQELASYYNGERYKKMISEIQNPWEANEIIFNWEELKHEEELETEEEI